MSSANVQFLTIEGYPCLPDQVAQRFTFRCVNRNRDKPSPGYPDVTCAMLLIAGTTDIKRDGQGLNGGRPQWDWDGNATSPTFSPSVNCESACGWHGYITNGRCVTTSGQDEPEVTVAA